MESTLLFGEYLEWVELFKMKAERRAKATAKAKAEQRLNARGKKTR